MVQPSPGLTTWSLPTGSERIGPPSEGITECSRELRAAGASAHPRAVVDSSARAVARSSPPASRSRACCSVVSLPDRPRRPCPRRPVTSTRSPTRCATCRCRPRRPPSATTTPATNWPTCSRSSAALRKRSKRESAQLQQVMASVDDLARIGLHQRRHGHLTPGADGRQPVGVPRAGRRSRPGGAHAVGGDPSHPDRTGATGAEPGRDQGQGGHRAEQAQRHGLRQGRRRQAARGRPGAARRASRPPSASGSRSSPPRNVARPTLQRAPPPSAAQQRRQFRQCGRRRLRRRRSRRPRGALRAVPRRAVVRCRRRPVPAPSTARGSRWPRGGRRACRLPHYSFSQFSTTRHIPLSMAQPGDLLFYFGGGTHHVAMYIGGGKMVHAANPEQRRDHQQRQRILVRAAVQRRRPRRRLADDRPSRVPSDSTSAENSFITTLRFSFSDGVI